MNFTIPDEDTKNSALRIKYLTAGIISIFLILNSLKISIFNMFIITSKTTGLFMYKFGLTFLLAAAVYLILFQMKSRLPFAAFYILQDAYILINLMYYKYFHSYLHISQALALSSEGMGAAGDLSALITVKLLIVLIDLPVFLYIAARYAKMVVKPIKKYKACSAAVISICVLIIAAIYGWNCMHQNSISSISKSNNIDSESQVVKRYGTLVNSVADMVFNRDGNDLISQLKYGRRLSNKTAEGTTPNFVVMQVESMDSNAVNKKVNGKYVMPFLHSLAAQNVYYPYTLSYHEAGGTSDCEFSTMNSIEPLGSFPAMVLKNYEYPNSLVRQLALNSYNTIAFHGNVGSYYSRDAAYPKMGYQKFFDINKMGLKEIGWGAPDSDVFKFAEGRLKEEKQPFFAYTITMTSHGPFTNVNSYYHNSNYSSIKDQTTKNYLDSMSYVDQSLQDYVNYIRSNFKNTYIIIYGDHTPGINNSAYSQASFTEGDRYFEFVPTIIVTPNGTKYTENKISASFLDIAPTLTNAAGIPYTIDSDGIDLLNRNGDVNDIPYRGELFKREYLYSKVSQVK